MKQDLGNELFSNPGLLAIIVIVSLWTLFWKGIALWRASQLNQKNWFVALFIVSTLNELGIIELIYLFWFSKKRLTLSEIKSWFVKK